MQGSGVSKHGCAGSNQGRAVTFVSDKVQNKTLGVCSNLRSATKKYKTKSTTIRHGGVHK